MIVVDAPRHQRRASYRFQFDRVSFRHVLDQLRLGVRIALIGASGMRDDGGIELLAEFAPKFGNAPFRVLGKFLCRRAVLNRGDGFSRVIFEVAQ